MAGLIFGTGGIPNSTKSRTTIDGIKRIAELGLGCMELEFVQGVKMGEKTTQLIADIAAREHVELSAHAPYFINFNAHEPEKVEASKQRLLQTIHIASLCGAESVVFHTAFYLNDLHEKVYNTVRKYLGEVLKQLKQTNKRVWIRPELMGKSSQFGSLEELLNLCTEMEGVAPCLDFAHLHARTGESNSYQDFTSILLQTEKRLGRAALDNMHIHVSGIAYDKKGETKHLNLEESDFQYVDLLKALSDYDAKGMVICESQNLEEDALLLQATYVNLLKAKRGVEK